MGLTSNVLVVGSGIAGQTLACALAQRSIRCELVELKPSWQIVGAGMYVQGNALKALADIGVVADVVRAGSSSHDDVSIFADADGVEIKRVKYPRLGAPDIPALVPIRREALHDILAARVASLGVPLRMGLSVAAMEDDGTQVRVSFTDGTSGKYGIVVGTDGIHSRVRHLLFGPTPPVYTGFANWRVILPRPPELQNVIWMNGGGKTLGIIPIAEDAIYLAGVSKEPGNPFFERSSLVGRMHDRFGHFRGMAAGLMAQVVDPDSIVYTPIEEVRLPPPWFRGRVIVIGDAAHAGSPFWAQGAAMAIEDAILLARLFADHSDAAPTFEHWMKRRYDRCKFVQEGSLQTGVRSHSEDPGAGERMKAYMRTQLQADVASRYAVLAKDF